MNVAFAMLPMTSHVNAVLHLAKQLSARGHDVSFLGEEPARGPAEENGFRFVPMLADRPAAEPPDADAGAIRQILMLRRIWRRDQEVIENRLRGELQRARGRLAPDVLVVDALYWYVALAARALGIPTVLVSTTLPLDKDPALPPMRALLHPDEPLYRLRRALAKADLEIVELYQCALGLGYRDRDVRRLFRRYRYGGPIERNEYTLPILDLPEIVLCPAIFDFPRSIRRAHRVYAEPSIDFVRREVDFPWERLRPGAKLVLCSLGTMPQVEERLIRGFWSALRTFARVHDDYDVVAAADGAWGDASAPPNLIVQARIPQLALLRRAAVLVTHGGLNSVKEAISSGVPMVLLPMHSEQPGNAARVVYHGLGRALRWRDAPDALVNAVARVAADPDVRRRCARMRDVFLRAEARSTAAETIERFLREQRAGATLTKE